MCGYERFLFVRLKRLLLMEKHGNNSEKISHLIVFYSLKFEHNVWVRAALVCKTQAAATDGEGWK